MTNIITILIAFMAGLVALYQVKSNSITSARITWIETLRNAISEYLSLVDAVCVSLLDTITKSEDNKSYLKSNDFYIDHEKYSKLADRTDELSYIIKLHLNIKENEHNKIDELLNQISNILENSSFLELQESRNKIKEKKEEIIKYCRIIFKKEWDKSKKLFTQIHSNR